MKAGQDRKTGSLQFGRLSPFSKMCNKFGANLEEQEWICNVIFGLQISMSTINSGIPKWKMANISEVEQVIGWMHFIELDVDSHLFERSPK